MDKLLALQNANVSTLNLVEKINTRMPEIRRALTNFGRQNSQTTGRLMSLTMLTAGSPYRVLRQCLAEIDKRHNALNEAHYVIKMNKIKVSRLLRTGDEIDSLKAEKLNLKTANLQIVIEGALKDIASYMEAYIQIRDTNNIRPDWDELDFENAEIEHHLRTVFQHGYRDVMMNGRLGAGTLEYAEQFGLHPQVLLNEVGLYVKTVAATDNGVKIDSQHLHDWMLEMAKKYKSCPENAAKQLGLNSITTPWALNRS